MRNFAIGIGVLAAALIPQWNPFDAGFGFQSAQAQQQDRLPRRIRGNGQNRNTDAKFYSILGRPRNGPGVGTEAPDFSLMPAKFYDFGIDDTDITIENADRLYQPVTLSDFRGKKPVVLIFGSYT